MFTIRNPAEDPAGSGLIIPPASQRTIAASELGPLTDKILLLQNSNLSTEAQYEIFGINLP